MKRNKIEYPIIKKWWPKLFWEECRFCKQEFRREKGFKIIDFTKVNRQLYTSYCCNNCADSEEEVRQRIHEKDLEFLRRRPNVNLKDKTAINKAVKVIKTELI